MTLPINLLAIITNTFTETLRQPIYGIVVLATIGILILSPSLVMFTLDDDNQLLKDVCLSTLLVAGLLLGVFAAATVVTEEIERKTTLTVLSKTVSRAQFVIGKFLGILAAVLLAEYLLTLVFFMVVRHGVLQTASERHDWVVITLGSIAAFVTFIVGIGGNYFYRWRFSSTTVILGSIAATLVLAALAFLDPHWEFHPAESHLPWDMLWPILLTMLAVIILTALAVTFATRLNMTMTLVICSLIFLMGIMFEHWLGPIARNPSSWYHYLAWIPLAIVPNISFYQVTNAVYKGTPVPLDYIAHVALYALLYALACLMFAIALFRSREIS
jgi:ABC-type transport system involved in multi-copper enzyme maturation permease subunit